MAGLLEEAFTNYSTLPDPMLAISVQWYGDAGITFNVDLREPSRSHNLRHAQAHEFGHVHRKHRGYFSLLQGGWERKGTFDGWLHNRRERECELIAAYLLVPGRALDEMEDFEPEYIAGVLDVPVHLVELRQEIRDRYKR